MKVIDAMGLLCPVPVIMARNAIREFPQEGGVVRVLVDNEVATENLKKMADSKGYGYEMEKVADRNYKVTITVGEGQAQEEKPQAAAPSQARGDGLVVAIGQNQMGHGSEELGKILIKGFIFSLSQLDVPPKSVVFFNSGVKLTLKDANTLDDLKALEAKGCKIKVCGTCTDFFKVKDDVSVGEIVNMYDIVDTMSGAQTVINI